MSEAKEPKSIKIGNAEVEVGDIWKGANLNGSRDAGCAYYVVEKINRDSEGYPKSLDLEVIHYRENTGISFFTGQTRQSVSVDVLTGLALKWNNEVYASAIPARWFTKVAQGRFFDEGTFPGNGTILPLADVKYLLLACPPDYEMRVSCADTQGFLRKGVAKAAVEGYPNILLVEHDDGKNPKEVKYALSRILFRGYVRKPEEKEDLPFVPQSLGVFPVKTDERKEGASAYRVGDLVALRLSTGECLVGTVVPPAPTNTRDGALYVDYGGYGKGEVSRVEAEGVAKLILVRRAGNYPALFSGERVICTRALGIATYGEEGRVVEDVPEDSEKALVGVEFTKSGRLVRLFMDRAGVQPVRGYRVLSDGSVRASFSDAGTVAGGDAIVLHEGKWVRLRTVKESLKTDTMSRVRTELAEKHLAEREEKGIVAENTKTGLAKAISDGKDDIQDASRRTAVRKLIRLVKEPLVAFVAARSAYDIEDEKEAATRIGETRALVIKALSSEEGTALLKWIIAQAWVMLKDWVKDPKLLAVGDSLAKELRVQAYEVGTDYVGDIVEQFILPFLKENAAVLGSVVLPGKKVRVATEATGGDQRTEEEALPAGAVAIDKALKKGTK